MCMWPPRWTTSAACWAWRASKPLPPATTSSWRGCAPSATSPRSGSRAPARMEPAWRGRCAPRASRWSRSTAPTAKPAPADAVEAARAALSGRAQGAGKTRDGNVEAIRALVVAKRSAKSTRIKSMNQIRHLGFTAPDELRERLRGVSRDHLGGVAAALRPRAGGDPVMSATKTAIRILGRRGLALDAELAAIDALVAPLMAATAPSLLGLHGVGIDTAATLLVAAGDNPGRLRSEAAWAHLCGVAPIQASSGKVTRWRLNRGGDRQANGALWVVVITRMRSDPRTRAYVERRPEEGRSKPEIIRILKRYVAREVFHHLPRA